MGKGNLTTAKVSTLTAGLGGCCWSGTRLSWDGLGERALLKKLSTAHGILASFLTMHSEQCGKGRRRYISSSQGVPLVWKQTPGQSGPHQDKS